MRAFTEPGGLPRAARRSMLADAVDALFEEILGLVARGSERGTAMGHIVDTLEADGHTPVAIEQAVWQLLAARRLTPAGFVCRVVRRRAAEGDFINTRTYEFLLIAWSPDLDRQLELDLGDRS